MKKIIFLMMLILSVSVFAAKGTIVFKGKIEKSEKVVTIYKDGNNLIYTFGKEGQPEIELEGVPGKNLFTNFGNWGGNAYGDFVVFKNNNFTYVLSHFDSYIVFYRLEVYQGGNTDPIFSKEFVKSTVVDKLILTPYYDNLPSDDDDIYKIF